MFQKQVHPVFVIGQMTEIHFEISQSEILSLNVTVNEHFD